MLTNRLLIFVLVVSCGLIRDQKVEIDPELSSARAVFIKEAAWQELQKSSAIYLKNINHRSFNDAYLSRILLKMKGINQLPDYIWVNSQMPYILWTPDNKLLFSQAIFSFLYTEGDLLFLLAFEWERYKTRSYPMDSYQLDQMRNSHQFFKLYTLDLERRMKLHKWATKDYKNFNADINQYLNFIQTMQTHFKAFSPLLSSSEDLNQEESQLKKFLIEEYKDLIFGYSDDQEKDHSFYNWREKYRVWK